MSFFAPARNVLEEFYSTTQINGISNASRATHPFRKIIWWVVTVVAAVATVYGIYDVIRVYLEYSISTSVSMNQAKYLTFPAVTVCNLSPFPCSKVMAPNAPPGMAQVLGCSGENQSSPGGNGTNGTAFNSSSDAKSMKFSADMIAFNAYLSLLSSLSKTEKVRIMQERDEFIRSCNLGVNDCKSYFSAYEDTIYGTCYTFNMILNNDSDASAGSRKTMFSGPCNGLELNLYLNASDRPPNMQPSLSGVRVVIHRPDSLPSPEEEGFHASAGFLTNVALREMEISRLAYPYENECYNSWDQCGFYPINSSFIQYDSVLCRRMCMQATMVKACKCKLPFVQDYFTFANGTLDGTRPCNILSYDSQDMSCLISTFDDLNGGSTTCPCNAECQQTAYQQTISSAEWPAQMYKMDAMGSMALGSQLKKGESATKGEVVKLVIYFSSMVRENVVEYPSVTSVSLLSTLGGALSLYLGISLVMFVEVIEILPLMILAFLGKFFGLGRKSVANPELKKRVPRRSARKYPTNLAWLTKP